MVPFFLRATRPLPTCRVLTLKITEARARGRARCLALVQTGPGWLGKMRPAAWFPPVDTLADLAVDATSGRLGLAKAAAAPLRGPDLFSSFSLSTRIAGPESGAHFLEREPPL